MASYLQRDARGPHFMIECACCGQTIHGNPNQSIQDVEQRWKKYIGIIGAYLGKKEHICAACINEENTGEHVYFWRW